MLARWVINDWDNINGKKPVNNRAIDGALNFVKQFSNRIDPLLTSGQKHAITKFMRRMAFQQFWHQRQFGKHDVARVVELFIKPSYSDTTEKAFFESYGLDKPSTLNLLIITWIILNNPNYNNLLRTAYKAIEETCTSETIDNFLRTFSLSIEDFESFSISNYSENYFLQLIEISPLALKPLLNLNNKYYCWSIVMIGAAIENGIYDLLKKANPNSFGDDFGPIFEGYIKKRLQHFNFDFVTESELKRIGFPKQVDFLLQSKRDVIFIESKAIEASKHAKTASRDDILQNAYEKDVVKAIFQAHQCLRHLQTSQAIDNAYLLIVTYKELYLGNGEDAYSEFIADALKSKYGLEDLCIPSEHIFFVPIIDFDFLILLTGGDSNEVIRILQNIVKVKKDPQGRRFNFGQYLEFAARSTDDPHLLKVFEDYYDTIIALVPNTIKTNQV